MKLFDFTGAIAVFATFEKRDVSLDVKLCDVGNSIIKASIAGTGAAEIRILTSGSIFDTSPIQKVNASSAGELLVITSTPMMVLLHGKANMRVSRAPTSIHRPRGPPGSSQSFRRALYCHYSKTDPSDRDQPRLSLRPHSSCSQQRHRCHCSRFPTTRSTWYHKPPKDSN